MRQTLFAVYGETNRIKTKEEHPNGEDFLITKIAQLRWLFDGVPESNGSWDILIVDDGCPDGSGEACARVAAERGGGAPVEVLYLQDAIDQKLPVVKGIASTKDSRKGGAVHYGAEMEEPVTPEFWFFSCFRILRDNGVGFFVSIVSHSLIVQQVICARFLCECSMVYVDVNFGSIAILFSGTAFSACCTMG